LKYQNNYVERSNQLNNLEYQNFLQHCSLFLKISTKLFLDLYSKILHPSAKSFLSARKFFLVEINISLFISKKPRARILFR